MQAEPIYGYGLCECGCGGKAPIATRTHRKYGWIKGEPIRFIRGHATRRNRYYEVRDCGYATPCWVWLGTLSSKGYGVIGRGTVGSSLAHRRMYEERVGPVARGLDLDHLCRNPPCVNPEHMEPVTHIENIRRGRVARLSRIQVVEIKSLIRQGWALVDIASAYEITAGYAGELKRGQAWADVP